MKQLKRKLWLKRGMIAGLTLATCTSFAVGALSWDLNSDKAYAAGGTVVSDFTTTDTTVTSAPAWKNGVNNNWVTPENLDTGLNYYDYTLKDGTLGATVLQDGAGQVNAGIDAIVAAINGETVEKNYVVPFVVVTSENVDQYLN